MHDIKVWEHYQKITIAAGKLLTFLDS